MLGVQAGSYREAVAEYDQALALDPTHFKSLFNRGFSYDKARCAGLAHAVVVHKMMTS
jgi:hypothetical protein